MNKMDIMLETTEEFEGLTAAGFEEMEQLGPKEIETQEEETPGIEIPELKADDIKQLQDRTMQLFEVMYMCPEEAQLCRNEIVELNIRLVPHVLKKYKPFGDDEFQMGCLGLIIATNTFKADRGVPFSNYACFCIERELHKAHRKVSNSMEYMLGNSLESLDNTLSFQNGDETNKYDTIADECSVDAFEKVLVDFDLSNLFDNIIMPSIERVSGTTKGQVTKIDFETWKKLELRYILEMAEVDSQKARITLTTIAKSLGMSVQNTRMRHQRVLDEIKRRCIEAGLYE